MAKAVFAVGRFQPPTVGHELLIRKVTSMGGKAFIFVSSITTPASENPLTAEEKIAALSKMFPTNVTFINTADCKSPCGGPVAANDYLRNLGFTDITLVAGSDRAPLFGPDANMWKRGLASGIPAPKFAGLARTEGRDATSMSGTKARALAREGKYDEFAKAVKVGSMTPEATRMLYDAIRSRKGGKTRRSKASKRIRKTLRRK